MHHAPGRRDAKPTMYTLHGAGIVVEPAAGATNLSEVYGARPSALSH